MEKNNLRIPKNNRKVINAWCSYDIANSVYNLVITSTLFPVYYQTVTNDNFTDGIVRFFGLAIKNTILYNYAIAVAYLFVALLSPLLSGIADYSGKKKRFMQFFTTIGSLACFLLFWFNGNNIEYGILLVILAVVGYAGSVQFYNSFLPEIASPRLHDKISAKGFAWGYSGSMVLLLTNIILIEFYHTVGFPDKLTALRSAFLQVGIWWILIAQIAFYVLKDKQVTNKIDFHIISRGFNELVKVGRYFFKQPTMIRFIAAFFFYNMGVQTIMLVATLFASSEIGISGSKLILVILILQILAIVGALLFGQLATQKGSKPAITIMLVIWIAVCIAAYFVHTEMQFFVLAGSVGLIMGGIQSQSRSAYSKLIPRNSPDTASFFSFYDVTEKMAIVGGMFSFGFVEHITGSMRNSTILLSVFFIIGLIFIRLTPFVKKYNANR